MQPTKDSFLKDVSLHRMKIINDNGIYRHIKFSSGSFNQWFEIVTWPGGLCYTGDMGTYVFSRVEDMFTFFRRDKVKINPQYWSEKCLSESRFGEGIRQFSRDNFEDAIRSEFRNFIEYEREKIPGRIDAIAFGKRMRSIWQEINDQLFGCENEYEAMDAAYTFDENGFRMDDFWEHTITEYTYHFIWCLYAIVWGIQQYDLIKEPK